MALDVVGIERLLDPDEVELFERAADPLGGRAVPLLVGIDHQRHAVADDLPHRLEAAQVAHRVGRAHLDLDPADAARDRALAVGDQLVDRRREEPARGVVALHGIAARPEQLGERQPGPLGLHVPERNVERGDRLRREPAAADRGAGPHQLVPDARDVARVLADQVAGDLLGVRIEPVARRRASSS